MEISVMLLSVEIQDGNSESLSKGDSARGGRMEVGSLTSWNQSSLEFHSTQTILLYPSLF